ncbi:hypothetical protein CKO33_05575 [Ectothiorhodospira mobilis]|nr:hypothetical protein [Ectothiorhodospira mobilis]
MVRIPGLSSAPGDTRMTLACIARQAPSEGPRQHHILWRGTQPAAALPPTGRGRRLGATFRIPGGLPAPQDPSPGPDGRDTAWELELVMRGPLGRLRRRFRLPAAGRDQRFQRT